MLHPTIIDARAAATAAAANAYRAWRMNGCKPRKVTPVVVEPGARPIWAGDCTGAELMAASTLIPNHRYGARR